MQTIWLGGPFVPKKLLETTLTNNKLINWGKNVNFEPNSFFRSKIAKIL